MYPSLKLLKWDKISPFFCLTHPPTPPKTLLWGPTLKTAVLTYFGALHPINIDYISYKLYINMFMQVAINGGLSIII